MKYCHVDTKKPDGCYVQFVRIEELDDDADDEDCSGIRAEARIMIVRNHIGTFYSLQSPGIWGIGADEDENYRQQVYEEELDVLKADLAMLANPIFETA